METRQGRYVGKGFRENLIFFLNSLWNDLTGLALQYGYPGVFVLAALGSAVPFLPLPYLAVVVVLTNTLNPLWLGVFAGFGGAFGKVTAYLLGRSGYIIINEETRRNLDVLHSFMAKYGTIGVFLFSVTPLPDDAYIVPMGMMRLPFWQFFVASLFGKVALSVSVAYLSRTYFSFGLVFLRGESLPILIAAISITSVISLILLKADWILAIKIMQTEGVLGLIRSLPLILRLKKGDRRRT